MLLALGLLQLLWLGSLLICAKQSWEKRSRFILVLMPLMLVVSVSLLVIGITKQQFFLEVIVFISSYQIFNLYRAQKSHVSAEHLRQVTFSSSFKLWLLQLLLALIGLAIYYLDPTFNVSLLLASSGYLLGLIILASTWKSYVVASTVRGPTKDTAHDLPTLTVAIPARNESASLNSCLESLLRNDYPKLEILVLDDNSTDKRTPEIIRSFAHDGVEFVQGKPFTKEWLAKNWAYQQLLEVANGELVLFCGADTRFEPDALRLLVSTLVGRNKQMLSVLPLNERPASSRQRFLQPLRYAWEVSIPRSILHRPPVLATCWLARRDFLNKAGGFKGVSRRISPESYFAKVAIVSDSYSFFEYSAVLSQKPVSQQLETAIRLRYPQLRRQVESVMLTTLVELLGSLGLLVLICLSLINHSYVVLTLCLFGYVFYSVAFGILSRLTYRKPSLLASLLWPAFFGLDLWIMHLSMWRYELGQVLWKGYSITPSVMQHESTPNA